MNYSDAGRLGWEKSLKKREDRIKDLRVEYDNNPKICDCGKKIPFDKRGNYSCCQSCASRKRNKGVRRHGNPPGKCEGCGRETRNPRFCCNQCQKDFEWKETKVEIERTGVCPSSNKVIRRYLIDKNGCRCLICGGTEWMGKPIPLEVDHISGDWKDHRVVNVRMVCGNCGMQLSTYKGKNRGKGRFSRRERYSQGKSY